MNNFLSLVNNRGRKQKGEWPMMKDIAWNTFKNTGNINTFLELKELENIQTKKVETNEHSKDEGNNNSRK